MFVGPHACESGKTSKTYYCHAGFPKMTGTFLWVPITRIIVYWRLYWVQQFRGTTILEAQAISLSPAYAVLILVLSE